jgi:hypothetical protein
MLRPSYKDFKLTLIMSMITTCVISFTLVSINVGFTDRFVLIWPRSWFIAFIIALLSILFVGPVVKKYLDKEK